MRIDDTVSACTVEVGDTVSFVCSDDEEQIAEILTVEDSFESCDYTWCLHGYSHNFGEIVTRFVDPDLEVDIVGEI